MILHFGFSIQKHASIGRPIILLATTAPRTPSLFIQRHQQRQLLRRPQSYILAFFPFEGAANMRCRERQKRKHLSALPGFEGWDRSSFFSSIATRNRGTVPIRCGNGEGVAVAIYRLLQNTAFSPEDVGRMGAAYKSALVSLNISRTDPRTEQIAKRIIEVAQAGVREIGQDFSVGN